jgi:cleavage and polyadenylation specificity factor subunit 1
MLTVYYFLANMYYPQVGSYSLELISPVTWETVDRYKMDEYEQVLCCSAVDLQSKETASGLKLFLAVGTGVFRGEDLAARGRVSFRFCLLGEDNMSGFFNVL